MAPGNMRSEHADRQPLTWACRQRLALPPVVAAAAHVGGRAPHAGVPPTPDVQVIASQQECGRRVEMLEARPVMDAGC